MYNSIFYSAIKKCRWYNFDISSISCFVFCSIIIRQLFWKVWQEPYPCVTCGFEVSFMFQQDSGFSCWLTYLHFNETFSGRLQPIFLFLSYWIRKSCSHRFVIFSPLLSFFGTIINFQSPRFCLLLQSWMFFLNKQKINVVDSKIWVVTYDLHRIESCVKM